MFPIAIIVTTYLLEFSKRHVVRKFDRWSSCVTKNQTIWVSYLVSYTPADRIEGESHCYLVIESWSMPDLLSVSISNWKEIYSIAREMGLLWFMIDNVCVVWTEDVDKSFVVVVSYHHQLRRMHQQRSLQKKKKKKL